MKTAIKAGISTIVILLTIVSIYACKESDTSSLGKKITLADSTTVLDMTPELPEGSSHLDAASEGFSNRDMELGPDFSEVELFVCYPYQMVFAYMCILESQAERAATDAIIRDEEQIESMVLVNLQAGAAEEGVYLSDVNVEISYPDVGDLAVYGSGTVSAYGIDIGYDLLMFKVNKVYVYVASLYLSEKSVSLVTVAEGIEQRIGMYSQ